MRRAREASRRLAAPSPAGTIWSPRRHAAGSPAYCAAAARSGTIVAALMSEGRFRRAYLGIAGGPRPLPPRLARELRQDSGVEVVEVVEGGPAAAGGLRSEDLIVAVDDTPIAGVDDLHKLMISEAIGRTIRLSILREGRQVELQLVPAELEG